MTPQQLREIRQSLGLTQQAMGEALGLAPLHANRTVRHYEAGTRNPSGTTLQMYRFLMVTRSGGKMIALGLGDEDEGADATLLIVDDATQPRETKE